MPPLDPDRLKENARILIEFREKHALLSPPAFVLKYWHGYTIILLLGALVGVSTGYTVSPVAGVGIFGFTAGWIVGQIVHAMNMAANWRYSAYLIDWPRVQSVIDDVTTPSPAS